jgi:predicted membrane chloride channel (bestrophin family)
MKASRRIDLGFSDKGHSMMSLFMSFLIISRVNISLSRYNESRGYLGTMYRESRALVQNLVVFTRADQSEQAKQWRHDMAYDVSMLLRLAMAAIDYPSHKIPCWQVPELRGKTKDHVMKNLEISRSISDEGEAEMTMRVPIQMSYLIRDELFRVSKSVDPTISKVDPWQYTRLFAGLDSFMAGYHGMRKFMTTPFPFPLVQMARTFMFIYIYTLPFAILNLADNVWVHGTIVFLVTYGFVGLETVSIELDDPFGEDDNDFDNLGMMYVSLAYRTNQSIFLFPLTSTCTIRISLHRLYRAMRPNLRVSSFGLDPCAVSI